MLRVGAAMLLCLAATSAPSQDENSPLARLKALKAERLSAAPQAAASTTPAKTVFVNCAKRGSISAALARNTGPLVIEVRGICQENVRIERSDVTLHGLDPANDGIRGVATDPLPPAAIEVNHASRIRLENISVTDSPTRGILARWSEMAMLNCRVERNALRGASIAFSSYMTGTEVVASQNGWSGNGSGIGSSEGSVVECLGCQLIDNFMAARSSYGGFITLWDSVVSGGRGITAAGGGAYVDLDCSAQETSYPCSLNVTGTAVSAGNWGSAALVDVGPFTGRVLAMSGNVVLAGAQQVSTDTQFAPNFLSESSTLSVWALSTASQLRDTLLNNFSHATLSDRTSLVGELTCYGGADVWSDTPYPGQVSGCEHVPTLP
jgi:hypothetical protein